MSELGRLLTETRTGNEISLADAEAETRIPRKYLAALEAGDYAAFHRGATGRGFLRNYAQFLGLDADQALGLFMAESGDPGPEPLASEDGQGRPVDYRPLEVELHNVPPRNWWPWVIAVMVAGLIGAGGWALLGRGPELYSMNWRPLASLALGQPARTPTATPTATRWIVRVTPTPPSALALSTAQATPTSDLLLYPTPTVQATITPSPRPTRTPEITATRIVMLARIGQRAYIRVMGDGKLIEETVLEAGQERTWEASQTLTIRTGNAAGVDLTLNDQALGAMGSVGQVLDRSFVVEGGQVVEAAGTPAPGETPAQPPAPAVTSTPTPAG
jgi:cytoskeletal protein RodZ